MSSGYRIGDQQAIHFLTFTVVEWIDLFTRRVYRDIILESFRYCQANKGLHVHAWVIMTNHAHAILSTPEDRLSDVVRDLKAHTSKAFIAAIEGGNESRREWMLARFAANALTTARTTVTRCGPTTTTRCSCSPSPPGNARTTSTRTPCAQAGWMNRARTFILLPATTRMNRAC
ncbi:MAG: transposase [Flavobacteriales bacterium]|nr:transposase [Flavobacteriales bacterium]MBP6643939.1 transposase [Flavobacteriales bacterium]